MIINVTTAATIMRPALNSEKSSGADTLLRKCVDSFGEREIQLGEPALAVRR